MAVMASATEEAATVTMTVVVVIEAEMSAVGMVGAMAMAVLRAGAAGGGGDGCGDGCLTSQLMLHEVPTLLDVSTLLGVSMLLSELRLRIVRSLACGHRRAEGAGRRRCTGDGSANAVRQRRGKLPSQGPAPIRCRIFW